MLSYFWLTYHGTRNFLKLISFICSVAVQCLLSHTSLLLIFICHSMPMCFVMIIMLFFVFNFWYCSNDIFRFIFLCIIAFSLQDNNPATMRPRQISGTSEYGNLRRVCVIVMRHSPQIGMSRIIISSRLTEDTYSCHTHTYLHSKTVSYQYAKIGVIR